MQARYFGLTLLPWLKLPEATSSNALAPSPKNTPGSDSHCGPPIMTESIPPNLDTPGRGLQKQRRGRSRGGQAKLPFGGRESLGLVDRHGNGSAMYDNQLRRAALHSW